MSEVPRYVFDDTEIDGVIAARLIIVASSNIEMAKLGYETDPGEFSYNQWMNLADQVLNIGD
jgi:hypothetical protein